MKTKKSKEQEGGTAGVACMRRGRGFVGVEIDPRLFAEAQARLEAGRQQGLLR